ncbi:TonB-dependent receptor [Hymenobacter sp. ASUV-10]|uniref:TonB-dependent receptor n=1 Tax=Hymenobacter aranciens TaxID=3063996 RepID=A0ABT9BE62_9BACT|nr:TonB-dependent receptor [Hymenobacter sp. ASUV-10]MDO7875322.1 TonB-dependent receptor [Hymenobacter sp. ASUV-10]
MMPHLSRAALPALLLLAGAAHAQTPIADSAALRRGLQEVFIVSPYRATDNTPVSFQNISLKTLEEKNFGQEPTFILGETPNVNFSSDAGSYSGYSYFRLRGIDQTRVNVTLNGVPMNEPEDQGAYFNNFPDFLNSVQSLQVQRGVGTSANGVASYAGSLNFESVSLLRRQREIGVGGGSFGTHREYAEYGSGLLGKQAFYLRASNIHSDGYKDRSSHRGQSLFYSYGYFGAKSLWKLTGYLGNQRNQQAWLGAPLDSLRRNPRYNANSDERDHFLQSHTQLQHSTALGANNTLTTALYYTFQDGNYDLDLNNLLGLAPTDDRFNYAFRYHLVGLSSTFSRQVQRWKLDAGLHANLYQRRHTGSFTGAGQQYQNTGHKNEASAFAKASYQLGQFSLFGDVQARAVVFRYAGAVEIPAFNYSFLNPRAGASYELRPGLHAYYSIGQTSREPTRNDLFMGNDEPVDTLGQALYTVIPPERVLDQELGVKWKFQRGHVNANLYYMNFSNEIVLNGKVGPNGLSLHSSAAESYRAGFELEARLDLTDKLALVNSSALSHNRIKEAGTAIQPVLTPTVIINQEVQYRRAKTFISLVGRYQGRSFVDYANTVTLPDFYTLGAQLSQEFGHLKLTLRGNNLTNRRYYQNGIIGGDGRPYYFLQAPVNYFASAAYSF